MLKKISVVVKPNSRVKKIEKNQNYYAIWVTEPPIEDRANHALISILAEYFRIPKANVRIIAGHKSKRKIVEIKTN